MIQHVYESKHGKGVSALLLGTVLKVCDETYCSLITDPNVWLCDRAGGFVVLLFPFLCTVVCWSVLCFACVEFSE